MVNPIDPSGYSSAQQQTPQRRGGSKTKTALRNGVVVGVIGAGVGLVKAPRTIKSVDKFLEQDTFEETLKVPTNASEEVKNAKVALERQKAEIERVQAANEAAIKKIFPKDELLHVEVDSAVKSFNPKYSTLAEAQANIAILEAQSLSRANLVEALSERECRKITRADLAALIKGSGYEGNPEEMAKKATLREFWHPETWFGDKKVKTDEIIKKITDGKNINAKSFKSSIKAESAELHEFVNLMRNPDMLQEGNLSRAAYSKYIEDKKPISKMVEEAKPAFDAIKKYIKRNRAKGAKIGLAIGVGVGIISGIIFGKSKKA